MKKIGLLFFLCFLIILAACSEVKFEPVTIEGFEVTTTYEQFVNQGSYDFDAEQLEALIPDLNQDRSAQYFVFHLELVEMQLADKEIVEPLLPTLESNLAVIETEGTAIFGEITFYHAGVYTFRIFQTGQANSNENEWGYSWNINESHFYKVVTVTEDPSLQILRATVHQEEEIVFINKSVIYVEEILSTLHRPLTYAEVSFEMSSGHALLINLSNGQVLFEHQADVRAYPASVTKIMTILIGLQNGEMDENVIVSADFEGLYTADAMQAGFIYGEVRTYSEILHAVMLASGGDATEALANHVAGSYETFVALMNIKARELGMDDTYFVTATGLHDNNHYTTAYDIAILLQYALTIPEFREMFTKESYDLETPNLHGNRLRSTLFYFAPTTSFKSGEILGGRTGFTTPAGLCLASLATNGEDEFILITFGAPDYGDTRTAHILDALMIYEYFLGTSRALPDLPQ